MESYADYKQTIVSMIARAKNNIHFSFDLWTANKSLELLGVESHFVDEHSHVQTIFIGLCRILGCHLGKNIAKPIIKISRDEGIQKKLGYLVLDNTNKNNSCVEFVLGELRPHLSKNQCRISYIGHILNIVA